MYLMELMVNKFLFEAFHLLYPTNELESVNTGSEIVTSCMVANATENIALAIRISGLSLPCRCLEPWVLKELILF